MTLELLTIGRISVDLYPEEYGPIRDVVRFRKSVGGTATNVAVAAARLGHAAAVATKVGDDPFGDDVRHALAHRFGVDTTYVTTHPSLKTPLAFAELDPADDPTIIFYREPKAPDMDLAPSDFTSAPIETVDILWVPASRFSTEPSRSTVKGLLERRAGRTHTVLDLDWRPQFWESAAAGTAEIEPLLGSFTLVVGNREECRIAVGTADPHEAADRLLAAGPTAAVIKLGRDGVLVALAGGSRELVAPFPVEVACGLGAGDAFGGALCHGLLAGWPLPDGVRFANAAGAIVASRLLCADDMPYLHEIEAFLADRELGSRS